MDLDDIKRTRSQYQNQHVALSHLDPLFRERCFMMMGSDPQSFKEDFHDPKWQETMGDEFGFIEDNKTWELVTLPPGRKLV